MFKFTKTLIAIIIIVVIGGGSLMASGGSFDAYKLFFGEPRWQTKFNGFIDAVTASFISINTLVTNWITVENIPVKISGTLAYVSGTQFTVTGDRTAYLPTSATLILDLGSDGVKFNTVASSSFGGGVTTVNLNTSNLTNNLANVMAIASRNGLWPWGDGRIFGRDYGVPGQAALTAALDAIGSLERTLTLYPGTWAITTDFTIPTNVTLKPERGAIFAVATGKTLTINGPLEAGLYQIFSCSGTGKVVYKGRKYPEWWGAKDDSGTTNNTAAITAALANGGLTKIEAPNGGYYKCTAALSAPVAATRVFSDSKAEIRQATAATKLFSVSASDVKFRGLKLSGVDVSSAESWTAKAAIYSEGTKAVPLDGLEVTGCEISNYDAGIWVPWTNAKIADNYIHDIAHGVIGGTGAWAPADQNLNGAIQYEIINNKIICTFGALNDSRPITLPLFTGGALITGNYLRGGGMAIENVLNSATANQNRVKITGNDCDTGISASNGDVIGFNTVDLAQAPVGRGQQSDFYQAIESAQGSTVIGNIVRNHTNGVGCLNRNQRIIGNYFIDCGDQGGAASVGMGFVVGIGGASADVEFGANTAVNAIITDNTFNGTKGGVSDIHLNLGGTYVLSGITISGNTSIDGDLFFILGGGIANSRIFNNYVHNACTSLNTGQAFGIWFQGTTGGNEYHDNTFINTVVGGYGMYQGMAIRAGDVVGFNKFVGMRNASKPIDDGVAYIITTSQLMDGARYNPKKGSFTAAAAATTTVNNAWVTSTCQIRLEPTNAAAAALMGGANTFYTSAKNAGTSFVLTKAGGPDPAGTETFNYEIFD